MMKNFYNDFLGKYQGNNANNTPRASNAISTDFMSPSKNKNLRIWGTYNYNFRFRTQGESLYQTSILSAEADTDQSHLQIPVKCKWYRIKNERTYQIAEISSNVYQLSAEDIGCKIRVEATPVEEEEYQGSAYGEFGPIELDPSARQTLEYILGTGGSQFPITVIMGGNSIGDIDGNQFYAGDGSGADQQTIDASLFVNSHVIKLCFNDSYGGTSNDDAIALKYTIDYPKIELHPYDTQKFKIFYSDDKIEAKYEFNKCIEMQALSRQSRDLIALAIKCFSAHTYFINSKIISNLNKDQKIESNKNNLETTISAVLLELEFVKRELYNQIGLVKELELEKQNLKSDMRKMEDEMALTIESYKNILESFEQDDQTDVVKVRKEMMSMTKQIESLEKERQQFGDKNIILTDEKKQLKQQIEECNRIEQQLREQVDNISNQMGIPKHDYEKLKAQLQDKEKFVFQLENDIKQLNKNLDSQVEKFNALTQKVAEVNQEKDNIKQYLHSKEEEVIQLRAEIKQQKEVQSKAPVVDDKKVMELEKQIKELQDENETLLVQRKTLTKNKESVAKDLERIRKEFEQTKQDAEMNLDRLKKANERLVEQNNQNENEKEIVNNEKDSLKVQLGERIEEIKELQALVEDLKKPKSKRQLKQQKKEANKFDILAYFDEEDSDAEQEEKGIQTDPIPQPTTTTISMQTDKVEEVKVDKKQIKVVSTNISTSSAKQTPVKQKSVPQTSSISLEPTQEQIAQQKLIKSKEEEIQNRDKQLKTMQKDIQARDQQLQAKDLLLEAKLKELGTQIQAQQEKDKHMALIQEKVEKLEADIISQRHEKNQEKQKQTKEINELQLKCQMIMIEHQEKEGCIIRLKEIINERDSTIDSLTKEVERLAIRLCTAEGKLFEYES